MNYLAHILLANHSEDAMIGAFLGDFMRPRDADHLSLELQHEMWLHRYIDSYTDRHPEVRAARHCCRAPLRLFARIALDVYFDHLLARRWSHYCDEPLDQFAARFYRALGACSAQLPLHVQVVISRMRRHDWLHSYRHFEAVQRAVAAIARRLSRKGDHLLAALVELREFEQQVSWHFERFFPQLQAYALERRAILNYEVRQATKG
ncbi:ACP phosphodiesterase [Pseudomarimonas arenosa]|uniref:DUF479 domain-containing protein n=1 Tax=Pseudomarimonas arenosa TaxID=2774145 RepID=A0AAW3ZIP3_9GAMM|nr:ACP phosphodiesterase [Pseudomarimonas arenosa]MBD8525868.1 DUF479 domain-containing protein [Pseudomarimonas arenosa]